MKKIHIVTEKKLNYMVQERLKQNVTDLNRDYEQEILKKQMDITMLQGQINPHFLYNALECIRGQALLFDVPEIADITEALSNFFRYSINTKSDIVSLQEELDNVNNYIKVQQYRFQNRFKLEIVYEKEEIDLMSALIPKLTLQPIIENSIVHGFERTRGNAVIKIEIIMTRKNLNIVISDNGVGMTKEQLTLLNKMLLSDHVIEESNQKGKHNGIAMPNVNKRLKLFYGEDYGITISSIEGLGTDVELHIPFQLETLCNGS